VWRDNFRATLSWLPPPPTHRPRRDQHIVHGAMNRELPLLPPGWRSPSAKEGMDPVDEDLERYIGCLWVDRLLRSMGDFTERTKINACAHYYFHAFFNYRSFRMEDKGVVSLASVFLACKVLENPRKMRDILRCYQAEISKAHPGIDLTEKEQFELREEITRIESFLLRVLSFDFVPPVQSFDKLEELWKMMCKSAHTVWSSETDPSWQKEIIACARSFMCDAYRGLVVHWYPQGTLAHACLRIACYYQKNNIRAVKELIRHWAEIFPERPPDDDLEKVKCDILQIFRIRKKLKESLRESCPMTLPDQSPWQDTSATQDPKDPRASPSASPNASSSTSTSHVVA